MKILPMGGELLHEDGRGDGQTDMTKIIQLSAFFRKRLTTDSEDANWVNVTEVSVCSIWLKVYKYFSNKNRNGHTA